MPTFRTVTLGCKVNQYETQYVREGLLRIGFRDAAEDEPADWCVVNTCTVTREADYKCRKIIRALARENPQTRIVVMGCYATRAAQDLARLPGVVEVLTDKRLLPDLLARFGLPDAPSGIGQFPWQHRAWIKVQDGCRMGCSYCIVPKVRPVLWSRPPDEVLDEVRRLRDAGYRELVLTGVHLGHYGLEPTKTSSAERLDNLTHLVERILALEGDFRLRLSSIEAPEVASGLIDAVADASDRVCPHLHLPLQSGSDRVLQHMGRRDSSRAFVEICQAASRRVRDLTITTDVIVGFPGESEADFQATCRVVEEIGFAKIHIFRYSPREGTAAAEFPGQIPEPVKQRRAADLAQLGQRLHRQFLERQIGRRLHVLVESLMPDRPGVFLGTSGNYASVEIPGTAADEGRLLWVVAREVADERVRVDRVPSSAAPIATKFD